MTTDVTMTSGTDTPADPIESLRPIIGRWRTSGQELDADGNVVREISGTDAYEWMEGGRWVIHHIDVIMGDNHSQGMELIGTAVEATHDFVLRAFDTGGAFSMMTGHLLDDGALRIDGDGARATLELPVASGGMRAHWERRHPDGSDRWIPWMVIRFDPEPAG
ncbi:MAG TPA: DUF1579 family protein [Thermomicrobiales bacterium]|jgi:hypothetical protein|nr:DUF1579 family protein [Thermomicrobiales bacterium]